MDDRGIWEGRLGACPWYVVADVEDFRALAGRIVRETDCVIEVGASTGDATVVLAEHADVVLAIERSAQRAEQLQELARARGNVEVVHADATDVDAIRARLPRPVDVVFLDLGGDAPAWRALPVCLEYARALEPRCVVLRNREFHDFLRDVREESPEAGKQLPRAAPETAQTADPLLRRHSAQQLCRSLQSIATPETAEALVDALREANQRTRNAIADTLPLLGGAAREPLVRLLADDSAPIRARRVSASLLREGIAGHDIAALPGLAKHPSVGVQWVATACLLQVHEQLGAAYRPSDPLLPGEELALAESRGEPGPVSLLASLQCSEDEFSGWLARRHLRRAGSAATRLLEEFIAEGDAPTAHLVAAVSALGLLDREAARRLPGAVLGRAAQEERATALWHLASQCVGLGDQRLATDLLGAIDVAWADAGLPRLGREAESDTPITALLSLWRRKPAAWTRGPVFEQQERLAAAGLDLSLAMEAGLSSPHPHLRERCGRVAGWLRRR